MQTLRSIEFFNDPEGGVMVRDTEGVHTYQPEDKMLTGALFTRIETEYPKAFKALAEIYRKSRANVNYYRFLICPALFAAISGGWITGRTSTGWGASPSRM